MDESTKTAFTAKMDQIVKDQLNLHDFIDYLCSKDIAKYVYTLRKAPTKKRPLSFDRLGYAILPIVKHFEVGSTSK